MARHSDGVVKVRTVNVVVLTVAVQVVAQFVVNCAVKVVASSSSDHQAYNRRSSMAQGLKNSLSKMAGAYSVPNACDGVVAHLYSVRCCCGWRL